MCVVQRRRRCCCCCCVVCVLFLECLELTIITTRMINGAFFSRVKVEGESLLRWLPLLQFSNPTWDAFTIRNLVKSFSLSITLVIYACNWREGIKSSAYRITSPIMNGFYCTRRHKKASKLITFERFGATDKILKFSPALI
jgi:hypothetical protein